MGPRRQAELLHRRLQESLALLIEDTVFAQLAGTQAAVEGVGLLAEALPLHRPCLAHFLPHRRTGGAVGDSGQFLRCKRNWR